MSSAPERKLTDEQIRATSLDDLNYKLKHGLATDADGYACVAIVNAAHDEGKRLYRARVRSSRGAIGDTWCVQVELFDPVPAAPPPSARAPRIMIECDAAEFYDGTNGGCLACGEIQYGGVEPDARGYECESCGKRKVYGLEELAIMGRITVRE